MAESLAAFPIGMSWRGQPLAPDAVARSVFSDKPLVFSQFFDQTHDGTTSDGEFTSLQSLHPLPAGSVATRYGSNDFRGLPAILAEHGYHTFSASAEHGDFWNKRQIHPRLGFSQSFFREHFREGEVLASRLGGPRFLPAGAEPARVQQTAVPRLPHDVDEPSPVPGRLPRITHSRSVTLTVR